MKAPAISGGLRAVSAHLHGLSIDKVVWVHVENGRVLSTRSRGNDIYYLPGGKREADESDEARLRREIREELEPELDWLRDRGEPW